MLKKIGLFIALSTLVAYRLMPHPYNLTPLLSTALFAGIFCKGPRTQWILPFGSMILSDAFLGFYPSMVYTYLAVAAIIGLGHRLRKQKTLGVVMGGSVLSSLLFYVISNFGVWLSGNLYALTGQGLIDCYVAAIPFLKNTLESTLLFSFAFYLSYRMIREFNKTGHYLPDAYFKGRVKGQVLF